MNCSSEINLLYGALYDVIGRDSVLKVGDGNISEGRRNTASFIVCEIGGDCDGKYKELIKEYPVLDDIVDAAAAVEIEHDSAEIDYRWKLLIKEINKLGAQIGSAKRRGWLDDYIY